MEKTLEFKDLSWPNELAVTVSTETEVQNGSELIFEAIEMLLGFVNQREYGDTDVYKDRLHGVINRCREKIYEGSEAKQDGLC